MCFFVLRCAVLLFVVVVCRLSFVVRRLLTEQSAVSCQLFVRLLCRRSLLVVRCWLFVVRCSLFVVGCWLFVVRCSLFVVRCSLFVVRCSLCCCWTVAIRRSNGDVRRQVGTSKRQTDRQTDRQTERKWEADGGRQKAEIVVKLLTLLRRSIVCVLS